MESCITTFSAEPSSQRVLRDSFGNRFLEAIWNRPRAGTLTMETRANVALSLHAAPARAVEYPLNVNSIPADVRTYLRGTSLVQTNDPAIRQLAGQILSRRDLTCEGDVVNAVVSWLVDHVQYAQDSGQYDASTTLRMKSGVCTGYSHLALALLRSMGIPARFAAGLSFQHPYQIAGSHSIYSMDECSLSGFLYHAWIEVYYPGEGWVECDPQGSFNFVDTRRVVFSVGLDKDSLPEGRYINTYA
ncbi:MAG: transglutaminase-like domain-containing protein, partial [Armatimonadota bacterium]|nr:transglutaminase-like domain-containing protein [Armatimonadota bacterium]